MRLAGFHSLTGRQKQKHTGTSSGWAGCSAHVCPLLNLPLAHHDLSHTGATSSQDERLLQVQTFIAYDIITSAVKRLISVSIMWWRLSTALPACLSG